MKGEGEKAIIAGEMTSPNNEAVTQNAKDLNDDDGASSSTNATNAAASYNVNKAKSCKGCLYYSSYFKANSRRPLCVGLTRSFPNVPQRIVGEIEMEASRVGRRLIDYRYACLGYSLYRDRNEKVSNEQQPEAELPLCVGLEVLRNRRANAADSGSARSDTDIKQDGNSLPQPQSLIDILTSEEFLRRLTRNADVVANGVAKHMRRVGEELRENLVSLQETTKVRLTHPSASI